MENKEVKNLYKALAKALEEMPVIVEKNKDNPYFNSRYADLGAVIRLAKPILARNGLNIVQLTTSDVQNGFHCIGVRTILFHAESGETLEDTVFVPLIPETGKKTNLSQQGGINITYFKRYAWMSICNLHADEDDTDGNVETESASEKKVSIDKLIVKIKKLVTENKKEHKEEISRQLGKYGSDVPMASLTEAQLKDIISGIEEVIKKGDK